MANMIFGTDWAERDVSISRSYVVNMLSTMIKPVPKQVIFNDPYTIVNWEDGTKTVVKCMPGDTFNKDVGFCVAVARKVFGGHNQYKKYVKNAQVQSNQAPA